MYQTKPWYQFQLEHTVEKILAITGGIFLFQLAARYFGSPIESLFGLIPAYVFSRLMIWQLVTYIFLHGDFMHLFFNMFALWIFGRELEFLWGPREFIKFYFITGIGAGIFTWITGLNSTVPTIGASGAIMGLLTAYAITFPNRYLYIYGIMPVKAKYLAMFYVVIEFFMGIGYNSDGIAHFAHLGGIIIAFVYLKKQNLRINHLRLKELFKAYRTRKLKIQHEKRVRELKETKEQVDLILDKINEKGIDSLTRNEKRVLEKASVLLKKKNT